MFIQSSLSRLLVIALLVVTVGYATVFAAETPTLPAMSDPPITRNEAWTPVSENVAGVSMVKVPAGCFQMGTESGRRDERPVVQQCLATFWIDRTEVTNRAFGSEGAYTGLNRPRENVTWNEAAKFCESRKTRLPTEAEWEYAARGPDGLIYPWGDTLDPQRLAYDKNMPNYETSDVGSYPSGASWVGALDMSGNVFEWVSSVYMPYPYRADDGRELLGESSAPRVYRGGWQSYVDNATGATARFRKKPDTRDWHIGFRCAVTR